MAQHSEVTSSTSASSPLMARISRWPRWWRIVLSMVVTTLIVALLWLVVTFLFGIDASSNAVVRLGVIFGGGLAVYIYGWWVLVGFEENPALWRATSQTVWYLLAGVLALVADIVLVLVGLASTDIL